MIERRTLGDQVYQHLLREIVSGLMPPGPAPAEAVLAMKLAVPRAAVREAVWRLASHGLVEARGSAVVVRPFGPTQVRQLFQVREALEGMAAELACGRLTGEDFDRLEQLMADVPPADAPHHRSACHRLDAELHALVARRCGNAVLQREIERLADVMDVVRARVGEGYGALVVALRAHLRIVEALRDADAPAARRAMADHLRESGEAAARWATAECPAEEPAAPATAALTQTRS